MFGEGNSYTAEYWQYDARIGRRWNIDPKSNPAISPYATFANNPIIYTDNNGDTTYYFNISNGILLGRVDDGLERVVVVSEIIYSEVRNGSSFGVEMDGAPIPSNQLDLTNQAHARMFSDLVRFAAEQYEHRVGDPLFREVTGIELEFTGEAELSSNITASPSVTEFYANGAATFYANTDRGERIPFLSVDARSGPWGSGPLPNGDYEAYSIHLTNEGGMLAPNGDTGFKFRLTDVPDLNRDHLLGHPDAGFPGTAGCIGFMCNDQEFGSIKTLTSHFLDELWYMTDISGVERTFSVSVDIDNNPNYSGDGSPNITGE